MKRIVAVFILFFLLSCQNQIKEENLIGKWHLISTHTNQIIRDTESYKKALKQLILTTSLTFFSDKTLKGMIWGDTTKGYWYVNNDSLVVYDLFKKSCFKVKILKLTQNTLILQSYEDNVKVELTFSKNL